MFCIQPYHFIVRSSSKAGKNHCIIQEQNVAESNMATGWDQVQDDREDNVCSVDDEDEEDGETSMEMETEGEIESQMKPSSSLQLILAAIAQERNRDFQSQHLISDGKKEKASRPIIFFEYTPS